jgi:hypothetical protein
VVATFEHTKLGTLFYVVANNCKKGIDHRLHEKRSAVRKIHENRFLERHTFGGITLGKHPNLNWVSKLFFFYLRR